MNIKKTLTNALYFIFIISMIFVVGCDNRKDGLVFDEASEISTNLTCVDTHSDTIHVYPKEAPTYCHDDLYARIPYSEGVRDFAAIVRWEDLMNSTTMTNLLAVNTTAQDFIAEINGVIDTVFADFGVTSGNIHAVVVGGSISVESTTGDTEVDPYVIVKFTEDLSEDDLTALNELFDISSITIDLEFDPTDPTDDLSFVLTRLSNDGGDTRFLLEIIKASGSKEELECNLEARYLTCGKTAKLDELLRVRNGEDKNIQGTEKVEHFSCSDIEFFVETDELIDYLKSTGLITGNAFDDGLIVGTLDLTEAATSGDDFGYAKLQVSYYQEGEWDISLTLEISDRAINNLIESLAP